MEQIGRPLYHDKMSLEITAHQASWQQWNCESPEADGKVLGICSPEWLCEEKNRTEEENKTARISIRGNGSSDISH